MCAGHSWSRIKEYTLAEIGIFLRIIIENEKETKAEKLAYMWFSHNLNQEGIKKMIDSIDPKGKNEREKEPPPEVVKNDWKRLARFMANRR